MEEGLVAVMTNDHFQNRAQYNIPPAQLVIADIPYNVGKNAYGSNPQWYVDGDNRNGESDLANSAFFDTDGYFKLGELMHYAGKFLKKEPKSKGEAGCFIIFCSFEQQFNIIERAKKHGFKHYINLVFRKNFSPQVLKANMRVVGNCEYALILYRDMLPKFRNNGKMIMNCMNWERDTTTPKVHPTQKPIHVIEHLIRIFTDPGDVVIDPVAGSGVTLLAAEKLGRKAYGFEIKKEYCEAFEKEIMASYQMEMFI